MSKNRGNNTRKHVMVETLVETPENRLSLVESVLDRQFSQLEKQDGKADRLFTMLTIATGIVGFIGPLVFEKLKNAPQIYSVIFSTLLAIFFLLSLPMVFRVLKISGPHIKPVRKHPKDWANSVSFYGGILQMKPEEYEAKMKQITSDDMLEEDIRQTYILSEIVDYKIFNLKKATRLLPWVYALVILIIVFGFAIYWLF